MKKATSLLALVASFNLGIALPAVAAGAADAHEHGHSHQHEPAPAKLQLNKGKKWETDASFRKAMDIMRAELAGKVHAIHKGTLPPESYVAIGNTIETQVATIVSQCKLEPKTDEMAHIVIGDLLSAAIVLQGKGEGKPAEAAHRAVMVLNDYGKYFAHPGWKAIR